MKLQNDARRKKATDYWKEAPCSPEKNTLANANENVVEILSETSLMPSVLEICERVTVRGTSFKLSQLWVKAVQFYQTTKEFLTDQS